MKQTSIQEALAKMSENRKTARAGLPSPLFDDVVAMTASPPSEARKPLSRLQRGRLERHLLQQQRLQRATIEDLELMAEALAEMNPRSPYRPRQQEIHRRTITRLAEINELVTSLQLQLERDNDDRSYHLAYQEQRREVKEYEERQQSCKEGMISLRPRANQPASSANEPRAMTSAEARRNATKRNANSDWPCTQDFKKVKKEPVKPETVEDLIDLSSLDPEIIPESPMRLPTPCGSRRSKSRLARTLSPGVQRQIKTSKSSRSSSSSDHSPRCKKLSTRGKKLYKKLTAKIESEAIAEEQVQPRQVEKAETDTNMWQWSTGRLPVRFEQQQQHLSQQPHQPQQQQRQPRRQAEHRWGDRLEDREYFHVNSTLGRPVFEDYPLVCPRNCDEFRDYNYCDHCHVEITGSAPLVCDFRCLDYAISGLCPHQYLDVSGFVPYQQPPPTQAASEQPPQVPVDAAGPLAAAEVQPKDEPEPEVKTEAEEQAEVKVKTEADPKLEE